MRTALSIAGSDSSGGAGIQADIKTMLANGVFAMTAITALTAQNTTGVRDILEATPAFLGEQIDAVFEDIRPDAVKIGMVSSTQLIEVSRPAPDVPSGEKHYGGPGDGGHQRFGADAHRRGGGFAGETHPPGGRGHPPIFPKRRSCPA